MAKKKKQDHISAKQKIGIGVGLTAAAVTAAGAYFLYGSKDAAKNRKTVKSWMLKAKAEVLERLEDAKDMSKEEYEAMVDAVAGTYEKVKSSTRAEVADFKREMKAHWKAIEQEATGVKKAAKKKVNKSAKKVVKKSAPKKK